MKSLKPILLLALTSLLCVQNSFGAPNDFIQMQIDEREERVEELAKEIKDLNKSIEKKLNRLEKRFLNVRDSRESMITVQQTKERLVEKLGQLAEFYQEQRDLFLKEAHRSIPRADKDTLDLVAKAYDAHIDDRIAQITRLNQSLAAPNPDSDKGRDKQIARRTREMRTATQETFREIIDRLEKENKELELRKKSLDADAAKIMEEVIEHNEELITKRTKQLEEMEDAPQIAAKPVSKSEALQLRKLLDASAQDIKEDSYRLANLAIEYAKEEESIRRLKAEKGAHPEDGHSH